MSSEIQVWKPNPFDGTDQLPVQAQQQIGPADIPLIEEHDVEASDIKLPVLAVLQGQSKPVQQGVEGAQPGKLYYSGNGEVYQPPLRMIVVYRFRGNAMFVDKTKPEYEGLEDCISRDGVSGMRYGDCESCKKCTQWREDANGVENQPPLGSKTQQFVVWLQDGIAILRVALSNKHAVENTKAFMTRRTTTKRNWFAHPTLLSVSQHSNPEDQTYSVARMRWDEKQVVPDNLQHECMEWYRRVTEALEQGTLSEDDINEERTPKPQQASASPPPPTGDSASDIPF